jgi:Glycosyl transferase family 2
MMAEDATARGDRDEVLLRQIEWLRAERSHALRAMSEIVAGYEELYRTVTAGRTGGAGVAGSFVRRWIGWIRRSPVPAGFNGRVVLAADRPNAAVLLPIRAHPQAIEIRRMGGQSLWATVVSGDAAAVFRLDVAVTPADGSQVLVQSLRLRAGRPVLLPARDGVVTLRRTRGELFLMKIEFRTEAPACAPADGIDSALRHTLWRAQELARDRPLGDAVTFAQATASTTEAPAVSLLEANASIADEGAWIESVNRYLHSLGVAPIALKPEGPSRFHRLCAPSAVPVDHGPLVTVLMPVFNSERTLAMAARSILSQSWRPLELIIVDDASTDGSARIAEQLEHDDPRVRFIRNGVNVGPYVSKNLALGIARGRYITAHDADDWAHPRRLEDQVAVMERSEGRFGGMTKQGISSADGALRDAPMTCFFDAQFMRERLGYWDSVRFAADGELIERVQCLAGERFQRLPMFALMYRDSEGSITRDPLHGISRDHGLSPIRRRYRDQWRTWHRRIDETGAYLAFPPAGRVFEAPQEMIVPAAAMAAVIGKADRSNDEAIRQ